ncbi:YesL family protein [Lederbergia panacisoli]|uniref:YesL family protein n=1 Tax=Lederbergia panacisoli TaxID=1255251 RepID=UPI00214B5BEC|nr:YesL family protein [Lederbergia panacisoli]MCR2823074.1 YesL family protein [Lederbergia panacisoli]
MKATMDGKRIVSTLDRLFQWIMRLAAVNGLWILFTIFGLFVGGIFPATVAALGVSRKWIMGEQELKLWKTFKQIYFQEFAGANILGWILLVVGGLLYLNYKVLAEAAGEILFIIPFMFYLILFFYCIIILWTFPLLVHYKASWFQHLRNALIIGLSKIHYTAASGLVIVGVIFFSLEFPGMIPFFSISIAALGCMWFSLQIFQKMDTRVS